MEKDRELLWRDICGRLPYKVHCVGLEDGKDKHFVIVGVEDYSLVGGEKSAKVIVFDASETWSYVRKIEIDSVRPYLRPMSSMMEEEQKVFVGFHCVNLCPIVMDSCLTINNEASMFDWLNSHHFDYRGLIEKGLALKAPEGMYKQ